MGVRGRGKMGVKWVLMGVRKRGKMGVKSEKRDIVMHIIHTLFKRYSNITRV